MATQEQDRVLRNSPYDPSVPQTTPGAAGAISTASSFPSPRPSPLPPSLLSVAGDGDDRARGAAIGLAEASEFIDYDPPRLRPPPEPPPQTAAFIFTAADPSPALASEPLPQRPSHWEARRAGAQCEARRSIFGSPEPPPSSPSSLTAATDIRPGAHQSRPSPAPSPQPARVFTLDELEAGWLRLGLTRDGRRPPSLPLPPPAATPARLPPDANLTPPIPDAHPRHWPPTPALATIVATSRDALPFPPPLPPPLPARSLEALSSASPAAGCGPSPPLTPTQATRSVSRLGRVDSSPPTCHLDFEDPTPLPLPPPPLICLPASLTDIVSDAASAKYAAAIQKKAAEAKVRAAEAEEERSRYRARTAEMAALSRRAAASRPRRRRRGARRGRTQGGATARPTSPLGEG
jgi:hypothetical protein